MALNFLLIRKRWKDGGSVKFKTKNASISTHPLAEVIFYTSALKIQI